jgi:hypothetical protein
MVQPITAREDAGQPSQPSTPLRTAGQIGEERGWTPPARASGPSYRAPTSEPAPQPTSLPAQQSAQSAQERIRGVVSGVGQQFRSERVLSALVAGIRGAQRSSYFRHAGLGSALAYTLDPEHYKPHPVIRMPRTVGLQPERLELIEHERPW